MVHTLTPQQAAETLRQADAMALLVNEQSVNMLCSQMQHLPLLDLQTATLKKQHAEYSKQQPRSSLFINIFPLVSIFCTCVAADSPSCSLLQDLQTVAPEEAAERIQQAEAMARLISSVKAVSEHALPSNATSAAAGSDCHTRGCSRENTSGRSHGQACSSISFP